MFFFYPHFTWIRQRDAKICSQNHGLLVGRPWVFWRCRRDDWVWHPLHWELICYSLEAKCLICVYIATSVHFDPRTSVSVNTFTPFVNGRIFAQKIPLNYCNSLHCSFGTLFANIIFISLILHPGLWHLTSTKFWILGPFLWQIN